MEINTSSKSNSDEEFDRQYDLTPLGAGGGRDSFDDDDISNRSGDDVEPSSGRPTSRRQRKRRSRKPSVSGSKKKTSNTTPSSFSIDPWETASPVRKEDRAFFSSMGRYVVLLAIQS